MQLVRQVRVPDRPVAWLYRVVRNGAISAARRDNRRQRTEKTAIGQTRRWFAADGESPLDAELAALCARGAFRRPTRSRHRPHLGRIDLRGDRGIRRDLFERGPSPLRSGTGLFEKAFGCDMADQKHDDKEIDEQQELERLGATPASGQQSRPRSVFVPGGPGIG